MRKALRNALRNAALAATPPGELTLLADVDLLLPMHHKDAPFVPSLLLSIEKNVPCYNSLVVVVPPESRHVLAGLFPSGTKLFVVPEPLPKQFG